jgi:hypothetical protein
MNLCAESKKSEANESSAFVEDRFESYNFGGICTLDLQSELVRILPVNLIGQQFARNFAGWYWFTKAADWRLRLQ